MSADIKLEPARFSRTGMPIGAWMNLQGAFAPTDVQALDAPEYAPTGSVRAGSDGWAWTSELNADRIRWKAQQ